MNTNLTEAQKNEINISAILDQYVYQDEWNESFSNKSLSWIMHHSNVIGENQILKDAILQDPEPDIARFELISQSNIDTDIPDTELIACAFKDPTTGKVYVAYRGTGDGKWIDNGDAFTKRSSLMQRRAVQYFDSVIEENSLSGDIIVTGHSKGGNSAQYVTMDSKYSYMIDNCYSLDGQGFSDEAIEYFKEKYGEGYAEQLNKMYSINGENDYVHDLGKTIIPEKNTYFIETTAGEGFVGWHTLDGYFNNGSVNWQFTEQGPVGQFAKDLSEKMMKLDKEDLEDCAISIMSFLEMGEKYKYGTGDRQFATGEEFIGFCATGIPLILNTALTSDETRKMIGGYIVDYINKIANSDYGSLKIAGGALVLAFATPFIVTKLVPLAIGGWATTYIAEKLFDLGDRIKEFLPKAAEFCRQIGETVSQKLNDFGDYISSKVSGFMSWISEGWKGKESSAANRGTSRAALILITPENIRLQAKTIRNYKQKNETTINKLRRLVYTLNESWKGEAQTAFTAKFQSMESIYKKFSDVLEQYASLLDKAANELQSADHNIQSMIRNI